MKIRLEKIQRATVVTVNGEVKFQGGRVAAKKFASQLAKENGVQWENVKEGGAVVLCD